MYALDVGGWLVFPGADMFRTACADWDRTCRYTCYICIADAASLTYSLMRIIIRFTSDRPCCTYVFSKLITEHESLQPVTVSPERLQLIPSRLYTSEI